MSRKPIHITSAYANFCSSHNISQKLIRDGNSSPKFVQLEFGFSLSVRKKKRRACPSSEPVTLARSEPHIIPRF